ncbi:MAG: DUF4267 domain-containing protein [Janthinobacterium lividum]
MNGFAFGLALLLAFAIIGIGAWYLASPTTAVRSFGLPLPDGGSNTAWWLRLKGVRDVASGVTVLALMISSGPRAAGIVLLAETIIPVGDMLVILAAKGSAKTAFGVHGLTALVMILAAIPLIVGAP